MDFSAFDPSRQQRYAAEVRAKWDGTDAYREFEGKGRSEAQLQAAGDALMDIFAELGTVRHLDAGSAEVQALIARLQQHITEHFYTCTPQILRGLGRMYIAGDEMTENIDRAGGTGTAQFVHRAIEIFCAK